MTWPPPGFRPPPPTRLGELVWLEPYPDVLLATDLRAGIISHGRDQHENAVASHAQLGPRTL